MASTSQSAPRIDPFQLYQEALKAQPNSKEQSDILSALRRYLETNSAIIPTLVNAILSVVVSETESLQLLKIWVIDLFHFAVGRSDIPFDGKAQMSYQALDKLEHLIDDRNPAVQKLVVQCLTSIYPLLFLHMCKVTSNPSAWEKLSACKSRILEFVWSVKPMGTRLAALKFLQRVILVQTRGISDPRLQNRNDPNISICPGDHPFINVAMLENDGQKLFQEARKLLYSSPSAEMDASSSRLPVNLEYQKRRKSYENLAPPSLAVYIPSNGSPNHTDCNDRGIQPNNPNREQLREQINNALAAQAERLRALENKKRPFNEDDSIDSKRQKLEAGAAAAPSSSILASFDFTSLPSSLITDLIVANLEAFSEQTLVGLVQTYRQSRGLASAAPVASSSTLIPESAIPSTSTPPLPPPKPVVKLEPVDPLKMDIDEDEIEYEPDRLNEELSGPVAQSDFPAAVVPIDLSLVDFRPPPPRDLTLAERTTVLSDSVTRIWDGGEEMRLNSSDPGAARSTDPPGGALDLWMVLLVRMITRVAEPPGNEVENEDEEARATRTEAFYETQDKLRQTLCEYVMADFTSRVRLATTWMNEEWYNDEIRKESDRNWRSNYDFWLGQIVASYQTLMEGKDRSFSRFLLDLPSVPVSVLTLMQDLCVESENPDRMVVGFTTLRDALNALLELTTHPDSKIRGAAINSVKLWVPNSQPMDTMIRHFALQMLKKLQSKAKPAAVIDVDAKSGDVAMTNGESKEEEEPKVEAASSGDVEMSNGETKAADQEPASTNGETEDQKPQVEATEAQGDENMEDGQLPPEELIQTPYLPERIELPAQKSHVLQHVELLFALSVKVPEFLDEIFEAYGQMDVTVQEAIQDLITALIRSLGSSHGKLLTLMRTCPKGSESLALRVLTIFTENGRPSTQLVALVKALISERDLDPRFLIPIIAEMDKPDILRYLPRIVSMLNGQPGPKSLVKSVFASVVETPPQTFGSVTSNMPRVRQNELLSPPELMVLLHETAEESGVKSTIEAIGICFSMTDVFRPDILAIVMQRIVDEPVVPMLFLRTVIQAVRTYTTLVAYVSTTLLSRLITKKIWNTPSLWQGFIICAMQTAPHSFGAILQLPKNNFGN
ncbi:Symplekin tight junction protein C terminal-domain-containing protein [Mycena floridula]|nr:Symplekin tight junction protein C terminal-domain-containing protein [Mycena floridula]